MLATVGSVTPFVGLFGTVRGSMDSFVGISQAHTSNLAMVAPGIAEALLATAVGLAGAIPAVVIFDGFARCVAGHEALLGDSSAEAMRHLSRDLDRREATRASGTAPEGMEASHPVGFLPPPRAWTDEAANVVRHPVPVGGERASPKPDEGVDRVRPSPRHRTTLECGRPGETAYTE